MQVSADGVQVKNEVTYTPQQIDNQCNADKKYKMQAICNKTFRVGYDIR